MVVRMLDGIYIIEDYKDVENYIIDYQLTGADITEFIEDVYKHYEVATRLKFKGSRKYFRELLSKLVKNYGH